MVTTNTTQTITGAKTFSSVVKSTATPSSGTDFITRDYADTRFDNRYLRNIGLKSETFYVNFPGGTSKLVYQDGRVQLYWNSSNKQIEFMVIYPGGNIWWDIYQHKGSASTSNLSNYVYNTRDDISVTLNTKYGFGVSGLLDPPMALTSYCQRNILVLTPESLSSTFKTFTIELWCGSLANVHFSLNMYGSQY
jgi:hypothetical protein